MSNNTVLRVDKKALKEAGLCCPCGTLKNNDGYVCCEKCRLKARTRVNAFRKALPEVIKERKRQVYLNRRVGGLCGLCGGQPREGKTTCDICISKAKARSVNLRNKVLDAYGGKCACCSTDIREFLEVDHINNDGAEHRRSLGGEAGREFYWWVVNNNFPNNLQLLCSNCNLAKYRYGSCPHTWHRVKQ